MKNVDKSLMWLRITCAAVWLAVFLMIGCLYSNLTKQKVATQTPVEKELEKLNVLEISPMQALNILYDLKNKVKK